MTDATDPLAATLAAWRHGIPDSLLPRPAEHREGDTVPTTQACNNRRAHYAHVWHDSAARCEKECPGRDAFDEPPTPPAVPVEVGDTVIYWNQFEHPRAAIVTGTRASLQGEQHVPIPTRDDLIYLVRFSPLGYHEHLGPVREWPGGGPKAGTWTRKP